MVKVKAVYPLKDLWLKVDFDDGSVKLYDVKKAILEYPPLQYLEGNPDVFQLVHVDCGGHAIAWNDELDITEYELFENGIPYPEETKLGNICFNKNGQGRAGTKITLPLPWIREMGIDEDDKGVIIVFDGNSITIKKSSNA